MTDIEAEELWLRDEYHRLLSRRRLKLITDRTKIPVDELIEEMRASADGFSQSDAFYDQLRATVLNASADSRDGLLQPVIDQISGDVRSAAAGMNESLPMPIFVGEYPHGSFNAQARIAGSGALLLINSGLFMLIYQLLKIVTLAINFSVAGDAEGRDQVDSPTPYSEDEVTGLIAETVLAYVLFGDSMVAAPLPVLGGPRALVHTTLVSSSETFAVGHEFGHVLAGHLRHPEAGDQGSFFVQKSHEEEYVADAIGAGLVLTAMDNRLPKHFPEGGGATAEQVWFRASIEASGPLIFFSIGQLVDEVRARVNGLPSDEPSETSTHPSNEDRYSLVRQVIESTASFDLSIADGYRDHLLRRVDPVVDRANELLRPITR